MSHFTMLNNALSNELNARSVPQVHHSIPENRSSSVTRQKSEEMDASPTTQHLDQMPARTRERTTSQKSATTSSHKPSKRAKANSGSRSLIETQDTPSTSTGSRQLKKMQQSAASSSISTSQPHLATFNIGTLPPLPAMPFTDMQQQQRQLSETLNSIIHNTQSSAMTSSRLTLSEALAQPVGQESFYQRLQQAYQSGLYTLAPTHPALQPPSMYHRHQLSALYGHSSQHSDNLAQEQQQRQDAAVRKLKQFIKSMAREIVDKYYAQAPGEAPMESECATKLKEITRMLNNVDGNTEDGGSSALKHLRECIVDVSPFEMQQSGIIDALFTFSTTPNITKSARRQRMRVILYHLAGIQMERRRLHMQSNDDESVRPLYLLVSKLVQCLAQQEQLSLRANDIVSEPGELLRGADALNALRKHHIKVVLKRHSSACQKVREWRHQAFGFSLLEHIITIEQLLTHGEYSVIRFSSHTQQRQAHALLMAHRQHDAASQRHATSTSSGGPMGILSRSMQLASWLRSGGARQRTSINAGQTSSTTQPTSSTQQPTTSQTTIQSVSVKRKASTRNQTKTSLRSQAQEFMAVDNDNNHQHEMVSSSDSDDGGDMHENLFDDDSNEDLDELELLIARRQKVQLLLNDQPLSAHHTLLQAILDHKATACRDGAPIHLQAPTWTHINLQYRLSPTHHAEQRRNDDKKVKESKADRARRLLSSKLTTANKDKASSLVVMRNNIDAYIEPVQVQSSPPSSSTNESSLAADWPLPRAEEMENDACVSTLRLLRLLYGLSQYWLDLYKADLTQWPKAARLGPLISPAIFVCDKLTAKANRQLQDVVSLVARRKTQKWIVELADSCPFILPFSVRRQLLYARAFGRARAMQHALQASDVDSSSGMTRMLHIERTKHKDAKREDVLHSAEYIFQQACSTSRRSTMPPILEVSFKNEAGEGHGPTLEFYAAVSRELQRYQLKLWHGECVRAPQPHNGNALADYSAHPHGLYPQPQLRSKDARIKKFELLGRLLSQAVLDARMIDMPLNVCFYRWLLNEEEKLSLENIAELDAQLYNNLVDTMAMSDDELEDMALLFTLPGYDSIPLIKNGKDTPVTRSNVRDYVQAVVQQRLVTSVRRDMMVVRTILHERVPLQCLRWFSAHELEELLCGTSSDMYWTMDALRTAMKAEQGFTLDSEPIQWLCAYMAQLSHESRRKFTQFITGAPRLPVGGFVSLAHPFTVACKKEADDSVLPSVMTCKNYLKMPAYSSFDVLRQQFDAAILHAHEFHLT